MPIKIPNDLPARRILESEGVEIIKESDAMRQDIRPMHIALLNLMPDKIRTETQIARVVGSTPLQVEMTLLKTGSYQPRNTPERHLLDFYKTWEEVRHEKFDGLIVTGAPIETLPFEKVDYW
ncbi:MAG TPA: homoserine O-succinyltransferase, partial [Kiloniellales bacterium]|nr:homoserine O-succinyltransferase [Kiloniellales bacterium]